jgi:hypothetical protein
MIKVVIEYDGATLTVLSGSREFGGITRDDNGVWHWAIFEERPMSNPRSIRCLPIGGSCATQNDALADLLEMQGMRLKGLAGFGPTNERPDIKIRLHAVVQDLDDPCGVGERERE